MDLDVKLGLAISALHIAGTRRITNKVVWDQEIDQKDPGTTGYRIIALLYYGSADLSGPTPMAVRESPATRLDYWCGFGDRAKAGITSGLALRLPPRLWMGLSPGPCGRKLPDQSTLI